MKTTFVILISLIMAVGLWIEIGLLTLIVFPVVMIFAGGTFLPFFITPMENSLENGLVDGR